jgi:hypothetical protein
MATMTFCAPRAPDTGDELPWTARPVPVRVPSTRWFWPLWLFIAAVSVLDTWLVVYNLSEMLLVERNIVCRALIRIDPEGLGCFLPAKAVGTAAVLMILRGIFLRLERHGMLITAGVALYQLGLVLYFLG